MKSFTHFLVEAISQSDLAQLRTDAGAFTKDVRRIKSGQELATVAAAWRRWCDHADDLIFKRLLGTDSGRYEFDHKEAYGGKKLRETMWTLVKVNNDIFFADVRQDNLRDGNSYSYTSRTAAWWDSAYAAFNNKRDSIYGKLGRAVREAFAALDDYFTFANQQRGTTTHPDQGVEDIVEIDGVKIAIVTDESHENTFDPRATLGFIRNIFTKLRAKGLDAAMHDLRIEVYPTKGDLSVAGDYNHNGVVRILVWGNNPHTVAHEIGHHFYYRMSRERQNAWDAFIADRRIAFDDIDYEHIHDAYLQAFAAHQHDPEGGYTVGDMWEKLVLRYLTDPGTKAKYKHFIIAYGKESRKRVMMSPFKDGRDTEENWQEFKKEASGGFLLFAPTGYANKNASEAFAEVFADYVTAEHPLADIMRAMFEDVTGLK